MPSLDRTRVFRVEWTETGHRSPFEHGGAKADKEEANPASCQCRQERALSGCQGEVVHGAARVEDARMGTVSDNGAREFFIKSKGSLQKASPLL